MGQYDSYYPFPDLHVNGQFTLGENIGDLGGISIALKAYQSSLNGQEAPVIDGFTGVQRVFIGDPKSGTRRCGRKLQQIRILPACIALMAACETCPSGMTRLG